MSDPIVDTAQAVLDFLQHSATTANVRALLISGENSIMESGLLTAKTLTDADTVRRASPAAVCLALAVQDAGEDAGKIPTERNQYVMVRVYDRMRGYTNLRQLRDAVLSVLGAVSISFTAGTARGLLVLKYTGRSGHRYDPTYAVDFEVLRYVAKVIAQEV